MSSLPFNIDWSLFNAQRETLAAITDQTKDAASVEHLEGLLLLLSTISDEYQPRKFIVTRMVQVNYSVFALNKADALEQFRGGKGEQLSSMTIGIDAEEEDA